MDRHSQGLSVAVEEKMVAFARHPGSLRSIVSRVVNRTLLVSVFELLAFPIAYAMEPPPVAEVQRLLNLSDMEILDQAQIVLTDRHTAQLLIVNSESWSHAEERQLVLYRPELKRAVVLDASASGIRVLDLDHDGVSEVEIQTGFTNQGITASDRSLAQFSGDEMIVLHTFQPSEDNEGVCGDGVPCEQTIASVEYRDLDSDGTSDIVETIKKVKDGKAVGTTTSKYLFKTGKVVQR